MSWKRNGFSYITWFLYLLIAGTGLFCLISASGSAAGLPFWAEACVFGACFPVAGALVFLIHRFAPKYHITQRRMRHTAAESLIVIMLVAAGIFLRVLEIKGVAGDSLYFDLASLDSAKQIPQFAHGAVYFYLRLLHTVFFFFGNELLAAIWFQILAQTVAFLLLYLAGRHMAGSIAALVMLGFCELSSYMIDSAMTLSPDSLYLLFWAASLIWIVSIRGEQLDPVEFIPVGIFTGLMGYVDVMGFLLLFLAFGVIFSVRGKEGETEGRKVSSLVCLIGTILFFFVFLFLDSILSKKSFVSVLAAWFRIYSPGSFRIPVAAGDSMRGYIELFALFAFLLIGVFSFFRDGKRDSLKGWVIGVSIVALGECFGIFTTEVPAATYLYILLALLAGIGVNECFRSVQPGMTALVVKSDPAEKKADNGKKAAADTGKEDAADQRRAEEKKAKKANKKKKKSAEEEKQATTVKADDVAAALFGGGAAAARKPAAESRNAGSGTESSNGVKAGGVKSEDLAEALFGGKASAPKPTVKEQPMSEQAAAEPSADQQPIAEPEETVERRYDVNAAVPESQTAYGDQEQSYEAPTGYGNQAQSYEAPTAYGGQEQSYEAPTGYGGQEQSYEAPAAYGGQEQSYEAPTGYSGQEQSYEAPAAYSGQEQSYESRTAYGEQEQSYEAPTGYSGQAQSYEAPTGYGEQAQSYEAPAGYGGQEQSYEAPTGYGGQAQSYGISAEEQTAAEQGGYQEPAGTPAAEQRTEPKEKPASTRFIENPLPLPKKHEKRTVDYKIKGGKMEDDYDYFVADDDDFDI